MTPDPRVKAIGEITTRHLFDMVVDLSPRLEIGAGPGVGVRHRRLVQPAGAMTM